VLAPAAAYDVWTPYRLAHSVRQR